MSSYKVTGAIELPRGPVSARVRVVSFKKGGEYITDPAVIQKTFIPEGFVFANGIRERWEDNALVEFLAIENPKNQNSTDDQFIMDKASNCSRAGYEIFHVPETVFTTELSIDLEEVGKYIPETDIYFYILIKNDLFGPLRRIGDYIEPSKDVCKISYNQNEFHTSGERTYILKKAVSDVKYDCMDREQLSDWLKMQLRNQDIAADFKGLKTAIQTLETVGLDRIRMHRAFKVIDQLDLGLEELKVLANMSGTLEELFEQALVNAREEIISPLNEEAATVQKTIDILSNRQIENQQKIEEQALLIGGNNEQLSFIQAERDRLIQDIRAQVLVRGDTRAAAVGAIQTFEVQTYSTEGNPYSSVKEFIEKFHYPSEDRDEAFKKDSMMAILQLKDFQSILVSEIAPVLRIANLSNNAKVIIQQVEPDWLKFESFFNNGLRNAWESAHQNPDMIHFLILEDLNMASPECYCRPLNDLLSGVRRNLPVLHSPFPENLWVFAIPIAVPPTQQFGLPLLRETFRYWGAFPVPEKGWPADRGSSELVLSPGLLKAHNSIVPAIMDPYFEDK